MAVLFAIAAATGGCETAGTGRVVQGRYFGLVTVRVPEGHPDTRVSQVDVGTLGVWLETPASAHGAGAGVGWRRLQQVVAPADCHIVILVRSGADVAKASQLAALANSKGDPCVIRQ